MSSQLDCSGGKFQSSSDKVIFNCCNQGTNEFLNFLKLNAKLELKQLASNMRNKDRCQLRTLTNETRNYASQQQWQLSEYTSY